jgi:hypothetical protein
VNTPGRNVPAVLRAQLLERSNARGDDFNLTLQRYAGERFLYRLGMSPHRDAFVLKGAMLFAVWGGGLYRATRDVDLAGYTNSTEASIVAVMREISAIGCPEDGIEFQGDTIRAQAIMDRSEYRGHRVHVECRFGTARISTVTTT